MTQAEKFAELRASGMTLKEIGDGEIPRMLPTQVREAMYGRTKYGNISSAELRGKLARPGALSRSANVGRWWS